MLQKEAGEAERQRTVSSLEGQIAKLVMIGEEKDRKIEEGLRNMGRIREEMNEL